MAPAETIQYDAQIQECLLALKEAGALPLVQSSPDSGVYRFRMRAGGWPIDVDLDDTVLEIRAYHGNDTIATGRVRDVVMAGLLENPTEGRTPTRDELAPLRAVVSDWKQRNARIFMNSPDVARHSDGWNNA